jgi:hypothetical protein
VSTPSIKTVFTASGTWNWPDDVKTALVITKGAGAGGGLSDDDYGGAGGSGGGVSRELVVRTDTATTLDVTIGSGSAPEADAGDSYVEQEGTRVAWATGAKASIGLEAGLPGVGIAINGGAVVYRGGVGGDNQTIPGGMFSPPIPPGSGGGGGGSSAGHVHGGLPGSALHTYVGGFPGTDFYPGSGAGGRGGKGEGPEGPDSTPSTSGFDAAGLGGGGGGGGQGAQSGNGGDGEVIIIAPAPKPGSRCCCGCDLTLEDVGLPTTISLGISCASDGDSYLPDNEPLGTCVSGDVSSPYYMRWSRSTAITSMLNGFSYSFVEQGVGSECGSCCFHYRATGTTTSDCVGYDGVDMGACPFPPEAIGANVSAEVYIGPQGEDEGCFDDIPPEEGGPPGPCYIGHDDKGHCPDSFVVSSGTLYFPYKIIGSSDLFICVAGNTASLCIGVDATALCKTYSGTFTYREAYHDGVDVIDGYDPTGVPFSHCECQNLPAEVTGDATEGCSGSPVGLSLIATADLTGISGATLWDKMQAATWTAPYECGACSCAGAGCSDSYIKESLKYCVANGSCGLNCIGESVDTVGGSGYGVDQICYYDAGTATITLA